MNLKRGNLTIEIPDKWGYIITIKDEYSENNLAITNQEAEDLYCLLDTLLNG